MDLYEDDSMQELPAGVLATVRGCAGTAGVINANHRLYPASVYARAVEAFEADRVRGGELYGQLDHPGPDEPPALLQTALRITALRLTPDHRLEMAASVLDTPPGRVLLGIVRSGATVRLSTRGAGSLRVCCPAHAAAGGRLRMAAGTADHPPHYIVGPDYRLLGIDAVISGADATAAITGCRAGGPG